MKILVNSQFGGFGLTQDAYRELAKSMPEEFEEYDVDPDWQYMYKGLINGKALGARDENTVSFRSHPALIELFNQKGQEIAGEHCKLRLVEVPDMYQGKLIIEKYDGQEWVAEQHKTW
jgi:hypothetical protein